MKETATAGDAAQIKNLSKNIDISDNIIVGRYPSPSFSGFVWAKI